ncbi:tumor necrosis factor receptor superfamily member 19 isoform X5 [Halichoerus grypus]|uniref:tumor necrosis factor receptor superfamily member 19 isoform X4 n=1 Tax=Halichoerus grypus TaxID=9711 RepID=UPI001659582D|nr:tumor necrosis factor receptor superfamily member 19 isoform X4 [Halichoerus grypus]
MALKVLLEQEKAFRTVVVLLAYLACKVICETGDCRQQEFRDRSGNCVLCKQCGPGMELSKECGFGYGEDAQCMTCRPHRFKEDWGFQKCKPCLECAVVNRFQKANCSVTSDAVCGDCLPGFYRKTKLVGFQDMECVPCGDPPPPYEPHCTSKVNLVKIPSMASSPRDTALAAVICSALATVLLALLILCVIYCKRQFMEKKPSWPVHLIPSLCCDEACSVDRVTLGCRVHSKATLQERHTGPAGETVPTFFGSLSRSICGEFSDAWPLMQNPMCGDDISLCDSYPELSGGDTHSLNPENESSSSLDSNSSQDLVGGAVPIHSENFTETTDPSRRNHSLTEPVLTQDTLTTRSQLRQESGDIVSLTTQTSLQIPKGNSDFLLTC